MENLFKTVGGLMWAVMGKLAAKLPAELVDELNNDPAMIDAMVRAAYRYREDRQNGVLKNPYEMTVEAQLTALRRANDEEKWGITEEDFARLAATAPVWPQGKQAYRSFRIRFGEGSDGVQLTFERHVSRIKSVFGESGFWRWEHLYSGKVPYEGKPVDRLRLLNGDYIHKAVVEWVIVDLGTHRKRDSVRAVRGSKSLADELLVIAWLFPDMIRAINHDKLPAPIAAGYESNVPECGGGEWQGVLIVFFDNDECRVCIDDGDCSDDDSYFSVPVFRE